MNIVLPLAGQGNRFRQAGYTIPKPMISVSGRPMLYWALDSLSPHFDLSRFVVVCLKEHLEAFPLERLIRDYSRRIEILALDQPTRGQAATVWEAASYLRELEPLVIYNGDTYMRSSIGKDIAQNQWDGVISVFCSEDSNLSYAQINEQGEIIQVREKEIISSYATTGLYHFQTARLFLDAFSSAQSDMDVVNGEYYVAPLYNHLMKRGYRFLASEAEVCYPLGTPEQLDRFCQELRNGKEHTLGKGLGI